MRHYGWQQLKIITQDETLFTPVSEHRLQMVWSIQLRSPHNGASTMYIQLVCCSSVVGPVAAGKSIQKALGLNPATPDTLNFVNMSEFHTVVCSMSVWYVWQYVTVGSRTTSSRAITTTTTTCSTVPPHAVSSIVCYMYVTEGC